MICWVFPSQFDIQASGSNWSLSDDGYWYYSQVVPVGGKTEPIVAAITVSEKVMFYDKDMQQRAI